MMKKKDFVTLLMGTIGGILFSLGMCMVLLTEWGTMVQGIVFGAIGGLLLLAIFPVRRRMEGKPAIVWKGKTIAAVLLGAAGAIVFGVGMCMCMIWNMLVAGTLVGILGIVLLLCLIPLVKGIQ